MIKLLRWDQGGAKPRNSPEAAPSQPLEDAVSFYVGNLLVFTPGYASRTRFRSTKINVKISVASLMYCTDRITTSESRHPSPVREDSRVGGTAYALTAGSVLLYVLYTLIRCLQITPH
jgi:hypothetical protein